LTQARHLDDEVRDGVMSLIIGIVLVELEWRGKILDD
jgi:hypothetical protein